MKNYFNKFGFTLLFLILTISAFGQQSLWSTIKTENDNSLHNYVPLNNVTNEVLVFYEQYNYYFDLSGYSKKRFIEEINYGFNDWNFLYDINELTVFALKSNAGRGSLVMVLIVSNDNVNLLLFSNDILLHENPQGTSSYKKDKFARWFKTLLN
jgi:hypothetical protein